MHGGVAVHVVVYLSSALVVGHPGTKRLICLPCLDSFQCNLMVLWALPGLSKLCESSLLQDSGW